MSKDDKRISKILQVLLEYVQQDFSQTIPVSDQGDEIDAIAVGLNTLREELENHILLLKEKTEQLQSVNKELEAFSYSVSHDLRAPLRAVSGFAQLLREKYNAKLGEDGERIIHIIRSSAAQMGTLIDELLEFSRLGRKDLLKQQVDMNRLVEGVKSEIAKSTNHDAEIKIGKLHTVNADYSLLQQVILNLLSNAVKYSSKEEDPSVEIFSEEKVGEIVYSVKDNGAGFDMEYAGKLFGVFQRLHSQEEFEGTGVGLAIVQRIISKHGGRVWAEAKLNEGATFHFSLPRA